MITITTVDVGPHTGSVFARWTDPAEIWQALQQMRATVDQRTADGRAYRISFDKDRPQTNPAGDWVFWFDIALERWQDAHDGELVSSLPPGAVQGFTMWEYQDERGMHLFCECGAVYTYGFYVPSTPLLLEDQATP